MNALLRFVVSLAVGTVAFVAVGAAATAGFGPWIEFSLFVGIPMGLSAGVTALFATYVGLWYRDRPAGAGAAATRALWAAAAAVVDFVLVAALGVGIYFLVDGVTGLSVLIWGLPASLALAAALGYLAAGTVGDGDAGTRSSSG